MNFRFTKVLHKSVSNFEMFYDLVFVYCISRITSLTDVVNNGFVDTSIFGTYFICFLIIIQIWFYTTMLFNRFGGMRISDYLCIFINMYLLYYMAQGTTPMWSETYFRYDLSWTLILLNLAFNFALKRFQIIDLNRDDKRIIDRYIFIILAQALFMIEEMIFQNLPATQRSPIVLAIGLIGIVISYPVFARQPVDFAHLTERVMLFVVVTFGETITCVAEFFESDTETIEGDFGNMMQHFMHPGGPGDKAMEGLGGPNGNVPETMAEMGESIAETAASIESSAAAESVAETIQAAAESIQETLQNIPNQPMGQQPMGQAPMGDPGQMGDGFMQGAGRADQVIAGAQQMADKAMNQVGETLAQVGESIAQTGETIAQAADKVMGQPGETLAEMGENMAPPGSNIGGFSFEMNSIFMNIVVYTMVFGMFALYILMYEKLLDRNKKCTGLIYMGVHVVLVLALSNFTVAVGMFQDMTANSNQKNLYFVVSLVIYLLTVFMLNNWFLEGYHVSPRMLVSVIGVLGVYGLVMYVFKLDYLQTLILSCVTVYVILLGTVFFYRQHKRWIRDAMWRRRRTAQREEDKEMMKQFLDKADS